jgi:hypothetical protein
MKRWIVLVLVSMCLLGCPSEPAPRPDKGPTHSDGGGHSH